MYATDLVDNPNLDISPITATATGKPSPSDELAHLHVTSDDIEAIVLKLQKFSKNKAVYANVRQVVQDAVIEESIDKTPTFTITIFDPDWELLNSGALDGPVDINPGNIPHRWYRLEVLDVNDDTITMTFATRNAVFLSMHKRPVKYSRGKMTRAQAILSLLKKVRVADISLYCPQLTKKQRQAKFTSDTEKKKKESREKGFTPSDKITVKAATATPDQRKVIEDVIECGVDTGMPGLLIVCAVMCVIIESAASNNPKPPNPPYVGAFQQAAKYGWPATGDAYKDAKGFYRAALPVYQENYTEKTLGWIVAKVQGVLGSDNPLNAGYAQKADRWRGEAQHAVNAYGGIDVDDPGSPTDLSEDYRKKYEFMVGEPDGKKNENYLGAIYRWADEVNWRAYWVRDVLHFMSEEDLFRAKARIRLRRYENGVEGVSLNRDQSQKVSQITLTVRMERWVCPVGTVVIWDEGSAKTGKGRWLVTNIRRSVFNQVGEVVLKKPIPEKKEPAPESGTVRDESDRSAGSVRDKIVIAAEKALGKQPQYRYLQRRPMNKELLPLSPEIKYMDCSEFVTLCYKEAGAPDPNGLKYNGQGYTGTLMQNGTKTLTPRPGDLAFYRSPEHVGVYVGGGQIIEMGGTPGPLRVSVRYRSDFIGYYTYKLR